MMDTTALQLLGLFAATALAGVVATRFSILLSHRLGVLDRPDPRKTHRGPMPYLGGLGVLLALGAGLWVAAVLRPDLAIARGAQMILILGGAVAIFLVGFWDDVRPLRAVVKLALQAVVAGGMWYLGFRVETLNLGLGYGSELGNPVSFVITVGWYVTLMNAINLVDGLDGLAGGITLIGAISLVGVSLVIGQTADVAMAGFVAILTAGAVLGFLAYNWHPARTFMGDGGSLLLGYLLATASLLGSTKTPTLIALAIPLVALGLPIFEISFSFFRRAIKGKHPFRPDRRHLHHRLLDLGLDQRRVVVILLFMTAFLGANSILLATAESRILLFNVAFLLVGLVILIECLKYLEKGRERSATETPRLPTDSTARPTISTKPKPTTVKGASG